MRLLIRFSVTLALVVIPFSTQAAEINTEALQQMEQRTFDLVNQHRRSIGEDALVWNERIASIARKHSQRMADGDVAFGHGGFAKRVQRIQQTMPKLKSAGENVAYTTVYPKTAKHIVNGWLRSSGHRANIETRRYNVSGMGVAKVGRFYYFTQLFVYR